MNKKNFKKITIVLALIILVAGFMLFGLGDYFSLSFMKESQEKFDLLYSEHSILVIAVYMVAYIIVTSLSLPFALAMSLVGGALFGLVTGSIVVSFASTIGATLACFVSRYVLRDWVQGKFGDKLKIVNEGFEKEGAFYLFSLRLIVVIPFWLINLVMGLTKIRLRTFFWVSQLGMIPGTIVVVNAGKELGKIEKMSGFFSPGLIISLAFLGLFPIATKKLMSLYKSRKDNKISH